MNKELEAFTCSVSHDMRTLLRHIDGLLGLPQHSLTALSSAEDFGDTWIGLAKVHRVIIRHSA